MLCPQHGIEFQLKPAGVSKRTGQPYSAFYACPTYGCKERPPRQGNYAPRGSYASTGAPQKLERNFDKEAYEKCVSIWWAAVIQRPGSTVIAPSQELLNTFWETFQAIRKDGEKRFATGWAKAEQVFKPQEDELPPIEAYTNEG